MTPEPIRNNDDVATFSPNRENREFTTSMQTSPRRPPISSPYGSKPEKNKQAVVSSPTRKWGKEVSRKDIIIVISLMLTFLIAAVVAFTILVKKEDTSATTSVFSSSQHKYDFILQSLQNSTLTADIADTLPKSIGAFDAVEGEAKVFALAAKWTVEVDPVDASEHAVLIRYVLATLYYAHGGSGWNRADNWMISEDTCEWVGVGCPVNTVDFPNVQELDLSGNNLVGTLSPVLSLLKDLKIIWLDHNAIAGPIRGDIFASLPNLAILYLQDNQLTGPISKEFGSTGMLYTLYVQGNQLTGAWPEEFCPICDEEGVCNGPFTNFGVDCQANSCPCCDPSKNCF